MVNLSIQTYTDKSFVLTGEDTLLYKDDIKRLGGKWNARLTNKETKERFGAWLFWSDKRSEVQQWLQQISSEDSNQDKVLIRMNAMVEQCERTLEEMRKLRQQHIEKKQQSTTLTEEDVMDDDDEVNFAPRRRLL